MNIDLEVSLSEYEKQRLAQETVEDLEIMVSPAALKNEFMCPICLEILKRTMTTKDCLHRFCYECINTAIRSGNKECPTCRRKLISKRDLRADPNYDMLISALFHERDEFQSYEEKILMELNKSQKIYSSTAEKMAQEQRQKEHLGKNKTKERKPLDMDTSTDRKTSLRSYNHENSPSQSSGSHSNSNGSKKQQRRRR